ncbi:MAG: transporter [Bacteroidetes bacterium]|nr:transporter [Bacteroidota bacterium]
MKKGFLIITLLFFAAIGRIAAQGCVAIRSTGGIITSCQQNQTGSSSGWLFSANNRYFKSYKHFIGTQEQKQRQEQGTEVINHSYTMDLALVKIINPRWSVLIDVPVESYTRSSLYEHANLGRYTTSSFGVGDIRFAVYSWIKDPVKVPRWNVQVGLGIKLPTGAYNYQDYFHITDTSTRLGAVDQSIQLGDGGTGITGEINAYYNFSKFFSAYGNFYYLSNPREQNGVSTARGGTPSALAVKNGSAVMSVPDQYMARVGINYTVDNFIFSAGVRDECLPVHDLVGGSGGFRRPGYIISAEPGLAYSIKRVAIYAFVPVAIVRNRTQSVPDKISSEIQGKDVHGDAAFADYTVNLGVTVRF